jgi:hypothetical protein
MSRKKDSKIQFNQTLFPEEFEGIIVKDFIEINDNQKKIGIFKLLNRCILLIMSRRSLPSLSI